MRADAQRNRERLIEAAREVFREQGYDASLDEVAKRAGVGAGTLYRHFPSRDVLMDAIMQSWVDRVNDSADKVLVHEGAAARPAAGVVRGLRRADQPAQGRPRQDHQRDGRRGLPDRHQVPDPHGGDPAGRRPARGASMRCASTSRRCRCAGSSAASPPSPTTPTSTRPPYAPCSRSSPTACSSDHPTAPAALGAPGVRPPSAGPASGPLPPVRSGAVPESRADPPRHRRRSPRPTPTASSPGRSWG